MTQNCNLGQRALIAAAIVLALVLSLPAYAGEKLVCRKGEPPAGVTLHGSPKIFADEVPEVGAIELAASRGRSRDGRTTVRLLALRVAFLPDTDPLSTGNGKFDLSEIQPMTFDSPPHDKEYFELHMTALANYFGSVSYDNLSIEFDVMPAEPESAYVLPHEMGYYHDYSEAQVWYVSQVESFTRDAFAAADTSDTIDFSQYDGYVLFHAGADWQSDISLNTPFDLPSAHILLGEPILVNDGATEVWGAAIMPETSSQDGLTMVLNGTLAHEVGHILGLPDLYNVSNFFPAIGMWGIMDSGGSIGMDTPWGWAYGVVPASPCAWSKEYLGWIDPVVLLDDADDVQVTATELRDPGFRLFKIPVTSDEYFLIENRLDDIGGDLTVAIEQERGVVLGPVDPDCSDPVCPVNHEYDFLLPGPGMLIYHIDDTRVQPGLMPWDTVNADRHRLGVAVEEADGIMDLGNIMSFYWSGSSYDPFFAENNGSFSWDTYPSTDTNMGGKTYLSVSNISDPGDVMTMDVAFDRWKDGWPADLGLPVGSMTPRVADIDGDGDGEVIVASTEGSVYAWHHDGTPIVPMCGVLGRFSVVPGGLSCSPSAADLDGDGDAEVIVASMAGSLYVWDHTDDNADGFADLHGTGFPVSIDGPASSVPVAADFDEAEGLEIAVASGGGNLTVVDGEGTHLGTSPYSFGHLVLEDVCIAAGDLDGDGLFEIVTTTTNRGWVAALNADGSSVDGWPVSVEGWESGTAKIVVGDIDRAPDGSVEIVGVGSDGDVHVWDRHGLELPGWPVDLGKRVDARPSLGDLDGDGFLEIVIPAGSSRIEGLRANGSRVENWPLVTDGGDSTRPAGATALIG
ncbi:MAG TPA: FG-GAP-like repeat-containing protein, partial [bacterium]|nr:FG-GAP-like repeat-containing protein [bacterium]